jgi:hypothetical protein
MYKRSARISPNFTSKLPSDLFRGRPAQIRNTLTPLEVRIDGALSRRLFGCRTGNYKKANYKKAYEEMCELVQRVVTDRGFPSRRYQ